MGIFGGGGTSDERPANASEDRTIRAVIYTPVPSVQSNWLACMARELPDWQFEPLTEAVDRAAVQYAIVWRPRPGDLATLPNLKAIVSIGAGVDHVLSDPHLPSGLPIIRTVGEELTQLMREYVALHVLRHHRDRPAQAAAQAAQEWRVVLAPPAPARRVGVLGLGNLGRVAAETIAALGFETVGWARSARDIPGVECFAGPDALGGVLEGTEILVNLLPLTPETRGILNADLFGKLAPGAALINAARGEHLVEADLLAALASGQIGQATLDVFAVEPLPDAHPFWTHPGVSVTAHIASRIDAETGCKIIARNLKEFEATGSVADIADPARGY